MKSFSVEVESTDQFKRLGATGLCYLHITDCELRLVAATDGHLLVAWPFKCLRRYMSSKGKFTIEAGRRAPTGEGLFTFFSAAHDDIYKVLDSVVKSKASKGQSSSPVHDEQKQQWMTTSSGSSKTGSTGCDDRYDHLKTSDSPLPPHHPHPNYNHGISATKGAVVREPRYASPYGHMLSKPAVTSTLSQSPSSPPYSTNELSEGSRSDFYDDHYDKLSTSIENRQSEEETYNFIKSLSISSSPPFVATGTESSYSVLGGSNAPGGSNLEPAVDSQNVYNTLAHQQNSPAKANAISVPYKSVYDEVGGTYNNLNPVQSPPLSDDTYNTLSHGSPVVKSWEGSLQDKVHSPLEHSHSLQQGGRYRTGRISHEKEHNTLSHDTHVGCQLHSPKSSDTTYNTLDHNRSHRRFFPPGQHDSFGSVKHDDSHNCPGPQIPERCPIEKKSEVIREQTTSNKSTVQRSRSIAETDLTRNAAMSSQGKTVSPNEQEGYASLDYTAVSPPAGKVPLLPTHKMPQKSGLSPLKPRLPPPRKGSAPDILVHFGSSEARSPSKSSAKGGNLISNLRASLEAGGLDLTRPKLKPKKLSAQLSQGESIPEDDGNYEAVDNQEASGSSKNECLTSLYSEANDIYDEPATCNSKSVPSGKPKKSQNK